VMQGLAKVAVGWEVVVDSVRIRGLEEDAR
jgi:hypothetical protein